MEVYRRVINDDSGYKLLNRTLYTGEYLPTYTDRSAQRGVAYSYIVINIGTDGKAAPQSYGKLAYGRETYPDFPVGLRAASETVHDKPGQAILWSRWYIPDPRPGIVLPNHFAVHLVEINDSTNGLGEFGTPIGTASIKSFSPNANMGDFSPAQNFYYERPAGLLDFYNWPVTLSNENKDYALVVRPSFQQGSVPLIRPVPNGVRDASVAIPALKTRTQHSNIVTPAIATPTALAAPDAPNAPTWTGLSRTMVELDWNDIAGAERYELQLYSANRYGNSGVNLPTPTFDVVFINGNGSRARIRDLPYTEITPWFRVRAVNAAGTSDWSPWVFAPYMTGTYTGDPPVFGFSE